MYVQYDHKKKAMAISLSDNNEICRYRTASKLSIWSMPQAFFGTHFATLNKSCLLLDLGFASSIVGGPMAFAHVGTNGWFLLLPCSEASTVEVINLNTKTGFDYHHPGVTDGNTAVVAARGDTVALAFRNNEPSTSVTGHQSFQKWGPKTSSTVPEIFICKLTLHGTVEVERKIEALPSDMQIQSMHFSECGTWLTVHAMKGCPVRVPDTKTPPPLHHGLYVFKASDGSMKSKWGWKTKEWLSHHVEYDRPMLSSWTPVRVSYKWIYNSDKHVTAVLAVDDIGVIVLRGNDILRFEYALDEFTVARTALFGGRKGIQGRHCTATNGFYLPGVGIVCGTSETRIMVALVKHSEEMAYVSPPRAAWMCAVYTGGVVHSLNHVRVTDEGTRSHLRARDLFRLFLSQSDNFDGDVVVTLFNTHPPCEDGHPVRPGVAQTGSVPPLLEWEAPVVDTTHDQCAATAPPFQGTTRPGVAPTGSVPLLLEWEAPVVDTTHDQLAATAPPFQSTAGRWLRENAHTLDTSIKNATLVRHAGPRDIWVQCDYKKQVMAVTRANDVFTGDVAVAVWAMPQVLFEPERGHYQMDPDALLFTLKPHPVDNDNNCKTASGQMAFAHVGEEGWFLLIPSLCDNGLVVYNLNTKTSYVYKHPESELKRPPAVAAHCDMVAVFFDVPHCHPFVSICTLSLDGHFTEERQVAIGTDLSYVTSMHFSRDGSHLLVVSIVYRPDEPEEFYAPLKDIQILMFTTHNWNLVHSWEWPVQKSDRAIVLEFDATSVIAVFEKKIIELTRERPNFTTIDTHLLDRRGFPCCGVFLPGTGIVCGTTESDLLLVLSEEAEAMYHMSHTRVAWMLGVYRGCVKRRRARPAFW